MGFIITDGNAGLENAVDSIYPHVKRQMCWAHKLRNVSNYLKRRHQDTCIKEARSIQDAVSRKKAVKAQRGGEWPGGWGNLK